jgi:hypothetical protein
MSERSAAIRAFKLNAWLGTLRILNALEFGILTDTNNLIHVSLTMQAVDNAHDSMGNLF